MAASFRKSNRCFTTFVLSCLTLSNYVPTSRFVNLLISSSKHCPTVLAIRASRRLNAKRFNHQASNCGPRILLLSRDQIPVTNSMLFEPSRHDEVRARHFSYLFFNPKWLNSFADKCIRVLFFGICETRPRLAVDQKLSVQPGLQQETGGMAEDRYYLSRAKARGYEFMQAIVVLAGMHGRLSTDEEDCVGA